MEFEVTPWSYVFGELSSATPRKATITRGIRMFQRRSQTAISWPYIIMATCVLWTKEGFAWSDISETTVFFIEC